MLLGSLTQDPWEGACCGRLSPPWSFPLSIRAAVSFVCTAVCCRQCYPSASWLCWKDPSLTLPCGSLKSPISHGNREEREGSPMCQQAEYPARRSPNSLARVPQGRGRGRAQLLLLGQSSLFEVSCPYLKTPWKLFILFSSVPVIEYESFYSQEATICLVCGGGGGRGGVQARDLTFCSGLITGSKRAIALFLHIYFESCLF